MRTILFLVGAVSFAVAVSCAFWELDAWLARREFARKEAIAAARYRARQR